MPIDWFTIVAQAINFLVLVWLLKRFLYKPILGAIDAREQGIAAQLADADAKRAEAGKERAEFQLRNEEFDRQRAALLGKATDEANAERGRLIDAARRESDAWRVKRQEAMADEFRSLGEEIVRRTRDEVFAIARKVLANLASTSLEERMVEVFLHRLHEMADEERDGLKSAFRTSSEGVIVRSAFELPAAQRGAIEIALKEMFAIDATVRFETAPDIVVGIEFAANGRKLAWSIADYLASLERNVGQLLKSQSKPDGRTP